MDITILIPTKNRHNNIRRILKYYKDFNFKGKLIIFDSSNDKIYNDNLKLTKKENNKNISILKYKAFPFQCFKNYKNLISTKYVCYSGDDDFFIIDGLQKSLNYLKKKKSYIGINGNSIVIKLIGKKYNKISSLGVFENFSSTKSSSKRRLEDLMKVYRVPLFSLFKTSAFLKMLDEVPNKNQILLCPSRAVNDELLESFFITYLGKIINKKFPFLIRTVTDLDKNYKLDHKEKGYKISYEFLKYKILKNYKNKNDIKNLNGSFEVFFKKRINSLKLIKTNKIKQLNKFKIAQNLRFLYFNLRNSFFLKKYYKFNLFNDVFVWIKKN